MELPILNSDSMLVLDDAVYKVSLLDMDGKFDKDHVYLKDEYFYVFRGTKLKPEMYRPGIYKDAATLEIVIKEPETDEEKEYYSWIGKVHTYDPTDIANVINTNDDLFIPVSDSAKLFNPEITVDDDILKRILKMLFIEKEIEIDNYKDRFPDKNALFNFKQVMKNPKARVTMKIFERACDVVGVEYLIVLREKENEKSIGKPLSAPITVSSEDTYEYGSISSGEQTDAEEEEE